MAGYGLRSAHTSDSAAVDIVFVHGLRGSIEGSWTKNGVLWPKTILPQDLPNSRILLFGYDSAITKLDQKEVTQTQLEYDAEDFCAKLAAERSKTATSKRPIIVLAHSLGGLVSAEVIVKGARQATGDSMQVIAEHIRGMIFFGTPFRGSKTAKPADYVRKILDVFGCKTQANTLALLGVDSDRIVRLNTEFQETMRRRITSKQPDDMISAIFYYETLTTHGTMIVEPESAKLPGCGESAPIRANHLDVCKFETSEDEGYCLVISAIRRMMANIDEPGSKDVAKSMNNYGKVVNMANDSIHIGSQQNTL